MKCVSIKSRLAVFAVFFAVPLVVAQPIVIKNSSAKSESKQFTSDTEMLNDVLGTIKEELKHSDGDAYLVECTYKMINNKPISASTKTYRAGYRKKTSRSEKKFSSNQLSQNHTEPTQIIEVVYKPSISPKEVSVITKNPSNPNCRLASKKVNLAKSLIA